MTLRIRPCLAVSAISGVVSYYMLKSLACTDQLSLQRRLLAGMLGCVTLVLAVLALDYSRHWPVSSLHSNVSAVCHYLQKKFFLLIGWWNYRQLMLATSNVKQAQEKFLLDRLAKQAGTEYGKRYNFSEIRTREDYVRVHPLTDFSHYKDYVDRVAKGEENVLLPKRPKRMAVSSGTSGVCKMIPVCDEAFTQFALKMFAPMSYVNQSMKKNSELTRELFLMYTPRWRHTEAGIPIGPISSLDKRMKGMDLLMAGYSSPSAILEVLTENEANYLHLLFALKDKHLSAINSNILLAIYYSIRLPCRTIVTCSSTTQLIRADEDRGRQLRAEFLRGVDGNAELGLKVHVDMVFSDNADIYKAMVDMFSTLVHKKDKLRADPERARELEVQFARGFKGICTRLWPLCGVLTAVATGAMELYADLLVKHSYCSGTRIFSPLCGASEGNIGLNLWPLDGNNYYLMHVNTAFFELIHESEIDKEVPATIFLEEEFSVCIAFCSRILHLHCICICIAFCIRIPITLVLSTPSCIPTLQSATPMLAVCHPLAAIFVFHPPV
ncbi:PREDICTED: uncharacterized protein LOC106813410 [Priapulus caudatus]|uniref:Uncharacterized protein LOC106813410 n=1 Tax=Priapulus caudatus TaxID=37621 RepID=A0ABM1ELF8_PRICU|nr:PREDICTED: uncharacterized protein LOC106813410 [Priapulus caudatus]